MISSISLSDNESSIPPLLYEAVISPSSEPIASLVPELVPSLVPELVPSLVSELAPSLVPELVPSLVPLELSLELSLEISPSVQLKQPEEIGTSSSIKSSSRTYGCSVVSAAANSSYSGRGARTGKNSSGTGSTSSVYMISCALIATSRCAVIGPIRLLTFIINSIIYMYILI